MALDLLNVGDSRATTKAKLDAAFAEVGLPASGDTTEATDTFNELVADYLVDPLPGLTDGMDGGTARSRINAAITALNEGGVELLKTSLGAIAALSTTGASCAVGFGGKLAALSNAGVPWVYNGIAWEKFAAVSGVSSLVRTMFVDSRGYIHMCPLAGGKIYRSTDGGETYAATHTWAFSDEDTMSFAEDDEGTLWSHSYGHLTKSVHLVKSTDGGATWTEVSSAVHAYVDGVDAGTIQDVISRHLHYVHWDKHRGWLFVSHGDAGSASPILVSTDRGATFHAWGDFSTANNFAASRQATVILTDENAIYYRADVGESVYDDMDDLGIYRADHVAGASLESLLATAPTKVWSDTFEGSVDGWSSAGGITGDGVIWFNTQQSLNYSGKLIASQDGRSFRIIYTTTEATGDAYGGFCPQHGYVSEYYAGAEDEFIYGVANGESIFAFALGRSSDTPVTYDDLAWQWDTLPTQVQKLYVDYETLPTPTSAGTDTGNAVDLADTVGPAGVGPFAGAKCAKFAYTGTGSYSNAQWNNLLSGNAAGSELIIETECFIEAESLSNNLVMLAFVGGSASVYVGCNAAGHVRVTNASMPLWDAMVSGGKEHRVPLNQWFRLRAVLRTGSASGEITVLIDDEVAFRVFGVPTTGDDLYQVVVGAAISGWTGNVFADNTGAYVIPAADVAAKTEAHI